jgi:hypothetical protein
MTTITTDSCAGPMTTSTPSSDKRVTVQIPTASGDAIEAWVYLPDIDSPSRLP